MRSVKRKEDMSQLGYLKILVQDDGDVIVAVYPQEDGMVGIGGSVEFCTPGYGGGRSSHTHAALRALADAMERDNLERPIVKKTGKRFMLLRHLLCWWYGHEQHPQDTAPPDYAACMYCGEPIPFGDMVGDTRHSRVMDWLRYWFLRRWLPSRCGECGKRWGDHSECLPF